MASKVFLALTLIAAMVLLSDAIPQPFQISAKDGANCKCMPWKVCGGEIDSSVDCHQSYIMICCVIPPPEQVRVNPILKLSHNEEA